MTIPHNPPKNKQLKRRLGDRIRGFLESINTRLIFTSVVVTFITVWTPVHVGSNIRQVTTHFEYRARLESFLNTGRQLHNNLKNCVRPQNCDAALEDVKTWILKNEGILDDAEYTIFSVIKQDLENAPLTKKYIKNKVSESMDGLLRLSEIRAHTLQTTNQKLIKKTRAFLIWGGVFLLLGLIFFMVSLWRALIPSLRSLVVATTQVESGDLSYRIPRKFCKGHGELSELSRGFNGMIQALEEDTVKLRELSQAKDDFVATVSHELRTPLTSIKGSLGLILGGVMGPLGKETRDLLEMTSKNTDRLVRLINDVLDIAKIEAGAIKLHFEKHNLFELVQSPVENLVNLAKTKNVELKLTGSVSRLANAPLVVVDRDRFEQIMTNLMSNAIKFSPEFSTVTIEVKDNLDHISVHIFDKGPGILPEDQNRLFQKFSQIKKNGDYRTQAGSGLGLAITKALVEEHQGSIHVVSIPGQGSEFWFALPWNGWERAASDTKDLKAIKDFKDVA